MLGDDSDRGLRNLVVARYVECHKVRAISRKGNEARVSQLLAASQGKSLYAVADGQGQDAAVVDLVGKLGQIEALDEVGVGVVRAFEGQRIADHLVLVPSGTGWAVPEQVDCVPRPPLAGLHHVQQIGVGGQLGEDANEDLVG